MCRTCTRSARSLERVISFQGGRLSGPLVIAWIAIALIAAGLFMPPTTWAADNPSAESVAAGASWLATQQSPDGGFPGFSGVSDSGTTADAVIALVASGDARYIPQINQALGYLTSGALVYTQSGPGNAARLSLALIAAGADPRDVGGVNPLSIVETAAASGMIGDGLFDHALGMLALAAAGDAVPTPAIELLRPLQSQDGSWSYDGSTLPGAGDSNTTAILVQSLVAAGQSEVDFLPAAIDYLLTLENGGGFSYQPDAVFDANSTALVLQALLSVNPEKYAEPIVAASHALASLQQAGGAFAYSSEVPGDNLYATVQALPAVALIPLPVMPIAASELLAATPVAA